MVAQYSIAALKRCRLGRRASPCGVASLDFAIQVAADPL